MHSNFKFLLVSSRFLRPSSFFSLKPESKIFAGPNKTYTFRFINIYEKIFFWTKSNSFLTKNFFRELEFSKFIYNIFYYNVWPKLNLGINLKLINFKLFWTNAFEIWKFRKFLHKNYIEAIIKNQNLISLVSFHMVKKKFSKKIIYLVLQFFFLKEEIFLKNKILTF